MNSLLPFRYTSLYDIAQNKSKCSVAYLGMSDFLY